MKWLPPQKWEPLKRGENCPMCADMHLDENPHSFFVAELSQSFVRLPRNQYMRGWTIVACKRHVSELFEFGPLLRSEKSYYSHLTLVLLSRAVLS